jgi:hypothetical protein
MALRPLDEAGPTNVNVIYIYTASRLMQCLSSA